jgi:amylosucrase
VHRPFADWARAERRCEPGTVEHRIFSALRRLIDLRKATPALADGNMQVIDAGNGHVFGYVRQGGDGRVLVLCNFSEREQPIAANVVRANGLSYIFRDLVSGEPIELAEELTLTPYQHLWLVAA